MINCQICQKPTSMMTAAHLRTHGISFAEYRARFPDAPTVSLEIEQKRSSKLKQNAILAGKNPGKKIATLDINDSVECLICGKIAQQITSRHLGQHGLTMEEYRARFPDSKFTNRAIRDRIAQQKTGVSRGEAFSRKQSESRKGKQPEHLVGLVDEAMAKKISRSRLRDVSDEHYAILNDRELLRQFLTSRSLGLAADQMGVSISLLAQRCKKFGIAS